MLDEILKQITDRGLTCSDWFTRRLPTDTTLTQAEHLLDWIEAVNPPKLAKMRWDEAVKVADKWTKSEQKKGTEIQELKSDTKLFMKIGKFKIVQLIGENAFKREGHLMSHCVASYYGKSGMKIYSLRDDKNEPHCTFEIVGEKDVQQIKGKGNGPIHPNYIDAVVQFLEKIGMTVRDSEMNNLGYVNLKDHVKYLNKPTVKSLFRGVYWNKKDKLLDVDGNEYANMDLWDIIPLVSETSTGLKINFELKSFIKLSIDFLTKQIKKVSSGDNSKNASSGDNSKNASSGDNSKNASSGYNSKNASSGYYSQNASSGDCSQNASSGDNSQNASSGYNSKNASSGYNSKNASSGDYSKNASSGDNSKNASSGDYSQNASSGDYSQNASSGYNSKNASSGDNSQNASSGHNSKNEMIGAHSVSVDAGHNGQAKGKVGCWFCLTEWHEVGDHWEPLIVKAFKIDGVKVKADTWYTLKNKKLVEVKNN